MLIVCSIGTALSRWLVVVVVVGHIMMTHRMNFWLRVFSERTTKNNNKSSRRNINQTSKSWEPRFRSMQLPRAMSSG